MSGIPVYTAAPISAKKPTGTTPQTSAPPTTYTNPAQPAYTPATTTATDSPTAHGYTPAQPGAAPPTPTPSAAFNRYAPAGAVPTPTTTIDSSLPPAPQPGAVPTPSSTYNSSGSGIVSRTNLPPPPKAGETYVPPTPVQNSSQQNASYMPPQMNIPAPNNTFGTMGTSGTSTTTGMSPGTSYPVPLPGGSEVRDLGHPPGYVQNTQAQSMNADQRRANEVVDNGIGRGSGAYTSTGLPGQNYSQGGYGGGDSSTNKAAFGVDPEAVWNGIKGWAGVAGKKLQARSCRRPRQKYGGESMARSKRSWAPMSLGSVFGVEACNGMLPLSKGGEDSRLYVLI